MKLASLFAIIFLIAGFAQAAEWPTITGHAAAEIMRLLPESKNVKCVDHHYENPITKKTVHAPFCEFNGTILTASTIGWWDSKRQGKAYIEIGGPLANEMIKNKFHYYPPVSEYISCSADGDFFGKDGVPNDKCEFIIEPLSE